MEKKKKSICLLLELTHAKYNDESQNVIICLLHGKRKASHDSSGYVVDNKHLKNDTHEF